MIRGIGNRVTYAQTLDGYDAGVTSRASENCTLAFLGKQKIGHEG